MYNPDYFKVNEKSRIMNFVSGNSFGTLFGINKGKLYTSHVPFCINEDLSELTGHLSIYNEHWAMPEKSEVLVEFLGPGHYISPTWYGMDGVVPTWNYVLVQITGSYHAITDRKEKIVILDSLVEKHENEIGGNWCTDWSDPRFNKMLDEIVAFRISVQDVNGKWKMNQNYPDENRRRVENMLKTLGTPDATAVSDIMAEFNR